MSSPTTCGWCGVALVVTATGACLICGRGPLDREHLRAIASGGPVNLKRRPYGGRH